MMSNAKTEKVSTKPARPLWFWIVVLPTGLIFLVFTFTNWDDVHIQLWPVASDVTLPLFGVVFVALAAGFFGGRLVAWRSTAPSVRRLTQKVAALERELSESQGRVHSVEKSLTQSEHLLAEAERAVAEASRRSAAMAKSSQEVGEQAQDHRGDA
ncbi:lipopolysaccharide assembly protein A [Azospirillaceae bacterium]